MDNLWLHKNSDLIAYAGRKNIQFVYNAIYSSEYNPIERLWAFAKKRFGREVVEENIWQY